ncbi:MAG: thymidylate synthase [Clostridia bacterium]|nr:thymidylate synthase [Clostridia bacterium]MDR3644725.1 thymidylate synthase [Clostridia bacterium]
MKHYFTEGATLPEAYHAALMLLQENGRIYPCPDYDTTMKEISLTFYVEKADAEPAISRLFPGGHHELQQYKMEICDGILNFMTQLGGNYWEYTYNQRFACQLPFILDELRRNPYSRRATMNIRDFDVDSTNDHPACLQSIGLYIRDGLLHMKITMRSNDAVQATYMNAFGFIALQRRLAGELSVGVGSYTHTAYSFHAYERSFTTLESYARDISTKPQEALTYPYEGFYDALMEEEIPSIMKMVEQLKKEHHIQ